MTAAGWREILLRAFGKSGVALSFLWDRIAGWNFTMSWMNRSLLAACALLALGGAAARAEDNGKEVDCADLAMKFNEPDFKVTCKDYSDPTALSNSGGTRVEALTAISDARQQIIIAVDMRALGNMYLMRRGFEEDIHKTFSNETLTDWKETNGIDGYEFAQYIGRDPSEHCIAFRRTMIRRNGGYGDSGFARKVVGFGCTTENSSDLVESLKKLEAPGG
jgi:hypothetical protein